jgi:mono/diheme cytochrome c family protein
MSEAKALRWLALGALLACATALRADPAADYVLHCQGCHGPDGAGSRGGAPPFAGNFARLAATKSGRAYLLGVPGVQSTELDAQRLAAVLNWIAERFDGAQVRALGFEPFSSEEVAQRRGRMLLSPQAERARVLEPAASAK